MFRGARPCGISEAWRLHRRPTGYFQNQKKEVIDVEGKPNSTRFLELEDKFQELEPHLPEGPQKEAISVLHAMIQEASRRPVPASTATGELTLNDIANLYKSAPHMDGKAENEPLPVGTLAPDFELPDANGKLVRLSDFRGGPVVIAFYPLDWSPTCSDQLSLYQSELQEFEKLGARVIGISVDSIYSHGAWAAVRGIKFPLLADFNPKGEVAQRYNAWRERDGFSERALYVVDGAGIIRYSHISPELHKIPDIYELFDALRKISPASEPAEVRR
jgi:peroxiredoxin